MGRCLITDTTTMARIDEVQISNNYGVKEFFNLNGQTACEATRNWNGQSTAGVKFGHVFVAISKNCDASAKEIFADPSKYQVVECYDNVNDTQFYRLCKAGSDYITDGEALSL